MNILHILSESESYDTVASVIELSTKLIDNDCSCIIAAPKKLMPSEYNNFSVQYESLPEFEHNIINILKVYAKLRMIIKDYNIDVLHSHSAITSWIVLAVARVSNVPFVTTCHDFYKNSFFSSSLICGKNIIVHNEAVGSHLLYERNIPRQHIRFIPQGIDLKNINFINPDQRSKTDFNIGVLLPLQADKGHEYFLKAMVKVIRSVPTVKIWIATSLPGSKDHLKKDFELLVRRLGLQRFVEFFEVSGLDFEVISSFNVLVAASTKEDALTRVVLGKLLKMARQVFWCLQKTTMRLLHQL